MTEEGTENLEDVAGGAGGEPTTEEGTPAGWGGPSEDEWKTVVGGLSYLTQQSMNQGEQENQPPQRTQEELDEMDTGELVQMYVDGRLSEIQPYVENAARESGQKRMDELFDHFETDPGIGTFDRKVAGKLAESLFNEVGDPVEAVRQAAFMTANFSKAERKAAVEEYKASVKKTSFSDPSVTSGGERIAPPAKTYDEVINRWAGQEEV